MISNKNIGTDEIDSYIIMYYRSVLKYSNIMITRVINDLNCVYTYIDCVDNLIKQRKKFLISKLMLQMIINEYIVSDGYIIKSYDYKIKDKKCIGINAEIIIINNKTKKLIK